MTHKILMFLIRILSIVFFGLLLVYAFVEASGYGYDIFSDQAYESNPQKFVSRQIEVKQGETIAQLASDLEKLHIVEDKNKFALSLRCLDDSNAIKPGIYTVDSSMKPSEILAVLSKKEE